MRSRTKWIVGSSIAFAFIVGAGVGASGNTSMAQPAPQVETRTVTKTVQLPPKTITKTVTPQSCTDVINVDANIFSMQADVYSALGDGDIAGAAAKIQAQTDYVNSVKDQRAINIATCEAS